MAEIVPTMPEPLSGGRYPWEQWLDGSSWRLDLETDFPGTTPRNARAAVYVAAGRADKLAKTTIREENGRVVMYLQARPRSKNKPKSYAKRRSNAK